MAYGRADMVDDRMNPELLRGKHIFIVEDNLENRVVFQVTLAKHGASVIFERWGRDTLFRMASVAEIDLIILDLMLALGVSGFDIYDEIRAVPRYDPVPIIAVSAMDPGVAMPKARAQGFRGFIAKPIENRLFPEQIAMVLDGHEVWHSGERT